ncbi:AbrB family transcriptional regulator [Saccharopolyspora rosea]|uniref:AbrB family transcriptional regulator n=1 Tax=Saccharopolyspora rosea TaxID=524884 RepID=A0ABW3FRC8_9PSEU|nr:AbrB family transcriptional regulator [Saccharopolyspora rosea]
MASWTAIVAVCHVLGNIADLVGVPAPHLLTALLVGVAVALLGRAPGKLPRHLNRSSQATVGVLMGSYLAPGALRSVADYLAPLALVTVGTIALCLVAAVVLPRLSALTRSDSVLGMVPGGSAAIIACADELDADARTVAFMQYVRVALVAATAPLVVMVIGGGHAGDVGDPVTPFTVLVGSTRLVSGDHPVAGLTLLAGLCLLGIQAGRRLSLPAPALLGPMLLAATAVLTGAGTGFAPEGLLQDLVFTIVGLEVGLRFSPESIRRVGRCVPHVLVAIVALCAGCAGLAAVFSAATGIPFVDAYLATTPGGINAVLATAASMNADLALISTAQSLRLFAVVLLAPPLIRQLTGPAEVPAARTPELAEVG